MWKPSLPQFLTRYLLQQIRPASSLRGQLLQLVRHQVNGEGKFVDSGLLTSKIKDPDFGIGDTTIEPTLWVGFVFAVAIALGWTPTHLLL